jgi:hypothetical protein
VGARRPGIEDLNLDVGAGVREVDVRRILLTVEPTPPGSGSLTESLRAATDAVEANAFLRGYVPMVRSCLFVPDFVPLGR